LSYEQNNCEIVERKWAVPWQAIVSGHI